jgi:superfamily II DNA or RNA helicase
MAKTVKAKNGASAKPKQRAKEPMLSNVVCPQNMTLVQWQTKLRTQAAERGHFAIAQLEPGVFSVRSAGSDTAYKVVYRGERSDWNYCSCMDFKTGLLGTCKHLEATRLWIEESGKRVAPFEPDYTSVYLSYRGYRCVKIRYGATHEAEMRRLAGDIFDSDGVMLPGSETAIGEFFAKAHDVDPQFRVYGDAMNYIIEQREASQRRNILHDRYANSDFSELLTVKLFPYQQEGVRFAFKAGKSVIADEMGLGKTLQAIATAELLRREGLVASALIVCPTSLKYQWKREIERFTHSDCVVVEGAATARHRLYDAPQFYKIVSYNAMANDVKTLRRMHTDLLVMDEVQRLKNWNTQISRAARRVESNYTVLLSGTPLENRLRELYSVMQFVDQFCLGPYYEFTHSHVLTDESGKITGYKNLNEIGTRISGRLLRRTKQQVRLQMPARTDKILFVDMTPQQREIHDEAKQMLAQLIFKWRRYHFLSESDQNRMLRLLSQMRMVCDSTFILDQQSRYDTKIDEAVAIINNVIESGDDKVVVFSQWERMTRILTQELKRAGIGYEYLHGGVPSVKRRDLIDNFADNPESRVFVSTDAGATGLNLQSASVLINLDLPWNPAVLEQRVARIFRLGQERNVQIINMVARDTIEERMLSTLNFKSSMFAGVLDNGDDTVLLEEGKLNKIIDSISDMVEPEKDEAPQRQEEPAMVEDDPTNRPEPKAEPTDAADVAPSVGVDDDDDDDAPSTTKAEAATTAAGGDSAQQLLSHGVAFLQGLSEVLSSPEKTRGFVDSITETDAQGRTSVKIPVPDKESVTALFSSLASLLSRR